MTTNLPQRRSLRLWDYDYSEGGACFVTLCTQGRALLFGNVINDEMHMSDAGRMVLAVWQSLPEQFPGIKVDICQVMPDHFHGIIWLVPEDVPAGTEIIKDRAGIGLIDIMQRFKSFTTNQYIAGVKENGWARFDKTLWQRSYYDHLIRNQQDLDEMRAYIANNPIGWKPCKQIPGCEDVGAGLCARPDFEIETQPTTITECEKPLIPTGTETRKGRAGTETRPYGGGQSGFTLIELIVVIVIIGILSVLGGQFIVAPIQGYVDLSRRAKLVDQAEMSLRRMQRDIRAALPNSIQLVSNQEISFEITVDGSRYRRYPGGGRNDILDFTNPDSSFEMLGEPNEEIQRRLDSDGNVMSGEELDIVIYNTSPAFAGNRKEVVAIKDVSTTSEPHYVVTFSPDNPSFPLSSPYQRFFILEKGIKSLVTYKCKMAEKELYRNDSLVTGNVDKPDASDPDEICKFTYNPGTTQRAGLVTLELTLTDVGETVTLLHQVHVVNAP